MDICVRLFCVCVVLQQGWSPVLGVLPTVYMIHDFRINSGWERATGPNPSR
jgi:hypothetical protein